MIRAITAYPGMGSESSAGMAESFPDNSRFGSARVGGPRAIGELLQQVLANYRLVDPSPQPPVPRLCEPEHACHAPSLSLS